MAKAQGLSGSERAAIFLMSLSEPEAVQIMKHMGVSDVQKIGQAMAHLRKVSRDQADLVLGGFTDSLQTEAPLGGHSPQFLRRLLTGSLGAERAKSVLDRLGESDSPKGLDSLQLMEAKEIAELIHKEHPQVVAIVLAGLHPKKSSEVVAELPKPLATDVLARIAAMNEIPQEALKELDSVMQQNFSSRNMFKATQMGGVRSAAEILNSVEKELGKEIITALDRANAELSIEIQDNMFVFENLLDVDDRGIQALAREITSETLIMALKGADEAMQHKIFSNMSKRAGELLRDDMDAMGPVKLADVEEAQKEIVATARRLADAGTLVLGTSSEEYV